MTFHVYLVTDAAGCSPLVTTRPIPWRKLPEIDEPFLISPRGSFARLELALAAAEEIMAVQEEMMAEHAYDARRGHHA